jgi:hypothetical protein
MLLPKTSDDAKLTVKKADPTVTVSPYTATYDGMPHTVTYTITGVNGETGATVGTIEVSATTHINAGTYNGDAWSFVGAANYNNTSGSVNDLITQRPITINVTTGQSKVYGSSDPTFDYTYTPRCRPGHRGCILRSFDKK